MQVCKNFLLIIMSREAVEISCSTSICQRLRNLGMCSVLDSGTDSIAISFTSKLT